MNTRLFFACLMMISAFWGGQAHAQNLSDTPRPLTIDLSVDKIGVHSGFTGAYVTLFGIQKQKGNIVIVIRGPSLKMVLREKSNVMGMWLTTSSVGFKDIPGFYSVASNAPISSLANMDVLKEQQIGLDYLNIHPRKEKLFKDKENELTRMQDAFIQTQQLRELFVLRTEPITYITDELFKYSLWFPSNIPVGTYTVDAYLFDNQKIIGSHHRELIVARAGFNASLRDYATDSPWQYALLTIFIAITSGWLATVILRRE